MKVNWHRVPIHRGQLYESVRWIPELELFQWVDILASSIHRWSPFKGEQMAETRTLDLEFVTVAIPLDAVRSIVASRNSLFTYDWSTGGLTELGKWAFPPDIRFNDGALSPHGVVHIGTMSMSGRKDAANLFQFYDGELIGVLGGIGISNGIRWFSPERAYYVDSVYPRVDVLTTAIGRVVRDPWVSLDEIDEPDGIAVAADGAVLVANWGRAAIEHIASDGLRTTIPVPARFPSSVALSGDERWMIVTTAAPPDSEGHGDGYVFITPVGRDGDGDR